MSYRKKYMNSKSELINFCRNVFLISLNHYTINYFKFWGPKNSHINRGYEANAFFNTL